MLLFIRMIEVMYYRGYFCYGLWVKGYKGSRLYGLKMIGDMGYMD
jgi:hypothetical protein